MKFTLSWKNSTCIRAIKSASKMRLTIMTPELNEVSVTLELASNIWPKELQSSSFNTISIGAFHKGFKRKTHVESHCLQCV